MKPLIFFLCLTAFAQSPDRKAEAKLADRFHRAQRELEAASEAWNAYCKTIDRVLGMAPGQTEPHCNPVTPPATPPKPEPKPEPPKPQ